MTPQLSELELYRRLLSLDPTAAPKPVLQEVLALAVAATSARLAYVAMGPLTEPTWWHAVGIDDEPAEALRRRISHTIVQAASREGELLVTHNAQQDPRFAGQASVRRHRIEQVLCGPVPGGVIYLQGRTEPVPFGDHELSLMRVLVRQLGPLLLALQRAAEHAHDPTAPYRSTLEIGGLLGRSRAMAQVFARVAQVAPLQVSVLISGPSGSGKTALAEAIHANSRRVTKPFVAVNCASLQPDRLHADLFGAAPGAYTGQRAERDGLVGAAHGGTLFLDEVGELPIEAQAQLLTFLKDGSYRRMGEERSRHGDVRVLAASAADLTDRTLFREDLYWRLSAVPIHMPPLVERLDDLPELAQALVAGVASEVGTKPLPISPGAMLALETLPWPGNVRELRQRLLSALLWAQAVAAPSIDEVHLSLAQDHAPTGDDLRSAVDAFKRRHVERVLTACDGNRTRAAESLGVNRTYLHELLAKWQVSDSPDTPR